ncbi:MAG TPA: uroporphyrinogen-III synthase [Blastocatellia bacterium]|nr:uroporphyrinogen-III synthase [Blastocatellia bacterium]
MALESHKENPRTRPLAGLSVLITRGLGQSAEMTALLEEAGATVIHCPTIEISEPESWAALDAAIGNLDDYDWVVFTSANGVEFFYRRLAEKSLPDRIIRCAIGPATAKALEAASGRVDVVAKDSKAEGALSAIIEHAGGQDRVRGLRFLIPRARVAREVLPTELSSLGARVDAVEAYQTIKPETDGEEIKRLLTERAIDVVTFTSSSTVANFAAIVGVKELSGLLEGVLVACIGPVTAATAREHGLDHVIQPDRYTAPALVESLIEATRKS